MYELPNPKEFSPFDRYAALKNQYRQQRIASVYADESTGYSISSTIIEIDGALKTLQPELEQIEPADELNMRKEYQKRLIETYNGLKHSELIVRKEYQEDIIENGKLAVTAMLKITTPN